MPIWAVIILCFISFFFGFMLCAIMSAAKYADQQYEKYYDNESGV